MWSFAPTESQGLGRLNCYSNFLTRNDMPHTPHYHPHKPWRCTTFTEAWEILDHLCGAGDTATDKKRLPLTFLCFRTFFGHAITVIHNKDENIMKNIFSPCLLDTFHGWNVLVVVERFFSFSLKNTLLESLGRMHHQIFHHLKRFCKKGNLKMDCAEKK